jgi:hypothetical protein
VANNGFNQVISGFGILDYAGSTGPASSDPNALSAMNFAGANLTTLVTFDDDQASPYPPSAPAPTADVTYQFNIKKMGQPYGAYQWTLSGLEAFNTSAEDQTPLLSEDPSMIATSDLVYKTTMGQWVDLIVQTDGPLAQPHPMHKHSNKAYVLGRGVGPWSWSTVDEAAAVLPAGTFNLDNPPLRDGVSTFPPLTLSCPCKPHLSAPLCTFAVVAAAGALPRSYTCPTPITYSICPLIFIDEKY